MNLLTVFVLAGVALSLYVRFVFVPRRSPGGWQGEWLDASAGQPPPPAGATPLARGRVGVYRGMAQVSWPFVVMTIFDDRIVLRSRSIRILVRPGGVGRDNSISIAFADISAIYRSGIGVRWGATVATDAPVGESSRDIGLWGPVLPKALDLIGDRVDVRVAPRSMFWRSTLWRTPR
jgi:hypothetical protein